MDTLLLSADSEGYTVASQLINEGKLVAFPTETVYGLGANAYDSTAVANIFVAKNRPQDNPLIVHVCHASQIDEIAEDINPLARRVIECFMPGSITIVLKKKAIIGDIITAGLPSVAIRMPDSQQARDFIEYCGVPIVAPSANTSTKPSPTNYSAVLEDMDGRISAVIAGEDSQVGIESTVVDLTTLEPTILRPGVVTASMLSDALGVEVKMHNSSSKVVNSPGTRYRHYAPSCDMVLNRDGDTDKVIAHYNEVTAKGYNAVIVGGSTEDYNGCNVYNWGSSDQDVAHNMFNVIRKLDKQYNYIIAVYTSDSEYSVSILNRLTKSTSGRIL